jgi:hypothetical protein
MALLDVPHRRGGVAHCIAPIDDRTTLPTRI